MKRILLTTALSLGAALAAHAGVILSDNFDGYTNGPVVGQGSAWTNHFTGTPIIVTNGQLRVSSSGAEDISAFLTGRPYSTNGTSVLYASFTLRCASLPSSGGGYFAHFKDDGTFNFRARIYGTTSGAATGYFRLGIANANISSGTVIPLDLDTNSTYNVVVRYDVASGTNATLWINPASEDDTTAKAIATDAITAPVDITMFAFRQASGIGTQLIDGLKVGTSFNDVYGANTSPTISAIANQNTPANTPTAAIPFTVGDGETPAGSLTVNAVSSNTALVPNGNIVLGGSDAARTITLTPAAGQEGTTVITLSVSDGVNTSEGIFTLTVGQPSISAIANRITPVNTPITVDFTIGDNESPASGLQLSGQSSAQSVVTDANITFGGSGANRTVTVTPETDQSGFVTITVFVTDGFTTNRSSFKLNVYPSYGIVFADDFNSYTNDVFLPLSLGLSWPDYGTWTTTPPNTNFYQMVTFNGAAQVTGAGSEDINAALANGPFYANSGVILYAGFTMKVTAMPGTAGEYFLHFKDSGSKFTARVYVRATNATNGLYRLGIANAQSSISQLMETDLNTNTTYAVVLRYNVSTAVATLWVNPASETSSGITATDVPNSADTVQAIALRQSSGIGTILVDDLKVSTAFADVLPFVTPEPVDVALSIVKNGANLQVSWPTNSAGFQLQRTLSLNPADWQDVGEAPAVSGDQYVLTLTAPAGNAFYQLKK